MARQQDVVRAKQITISTGQGIFEMLKSMASTQMYGNNVAAVAEELMRLKLMELVEQGKLSPPPRTPTPWEAAPGSQSKESRK